MKKIMISVAPVAATDILINPRAIARDVYECYKNGASMVHLHCRDLNGNLTPDLSLLEETVAYIREMCDIVVEISTGGVSNLTIEERVQPCYPSWVEANSLNVGSVNLGTSVYQNPIKDVEYCVKTIMDNKKIPETEVFELGMINTGTERQVPLCKTHPVCTGVRPWRRDACHGAGPAPHDPGAGRELSQRRLPVGLHAGPPRGLGNGQDCAGYGRFHRAHRL